MSKKSDRLRMDLQLIIHLCRRLKVSPYSVGRYVKLVDAENERSNDDPRTSLKNYIEADYEGMLDDPRDEIIYEGKQVLGLLKMLGGKP